ncbi:MAG: hypothetical protein JO249_22345 [Acidobacteria bacterium]|nr:hypothetical protein [Acidobacteriota bacterium]
MFFHGFVGVTLTWQLLFSAIAWQSVRLYPVIPYAVLEKFDLAWAMVFVLVWRRVAGEIVAA